MVRQTPFPQDAQSGEKEGGTCVTMKSVSYHLEICVICEGAARVGEQGSCVSSGVFRLERDARDEAGI